MIELYEKDGDLPIEEIERRHRLLASSVLFFVEGDFRKGGKR